MQARVIDDLLDTAKAMQGELIVENRPAAVATLIESAIEIAEPAARARGVAFRLRYDPRPRLVDVDPHRLQRALANLIANALKFTPRGGRIRVEVERGTDELRCAVHDTGSGIPAHMLEAVFQRFCQGRNNDRRGIGLGLYITRCIVEAHRGRIWAESIEGVGSTLRFSLPFV
jgi:signal transduction histidine kinase